MYFGQYLVALWDDNTTKYLVEKKYSYKYFFKFILLSFML